MLELFINKQLIASRATFGTCSLCVAFPSTPHRVFAHVANLLPPDWQDPVPDYERLSHQLWRPHRMNIEHLVSSLLLALFVHVVAHL
jgi:hypothetical protein